ncbi:alpha/beta fold hydrolase [Marinobacter sp. R17]|uniref:alpha/beta fold hydrolase n=1 Tax=Marinobacter sp. R17 TaxID=2484250 RepID=UPI000F4CCB95|nr:alpha/beta fold hydrolase [Marinobacter sp. R17]ROT94586.1 alpha/beta fold hydrolase [Marinobacter sp. R17]
MLRPLPAAFRPCALLILLVSILLLSGCSREAIYDAMMAHERKAAGLLDAQIEVGDRTIAYLHNEYPVDGPTLVLLHGFAANKENWLRLSRELTDHYNVYAIDLPGHGASDKDLDRDYSIGAQAGYVKAILDTLDLKRVHMVGNSMGGAITAQFAATYPDRVASATLLDPAGVMTYDSELVERVKAGDNPLIVEQPGDFEKLVDFALEQKPFVPWPIYSVMEDRALADRAIHHRIFEQIEKSGYDAAFRDHLASIRAPVLIVWGRDDRVINYRNADVFEERIPNARKVILEHVGHAPMIEVPEQTARLIRDFIQDQTDR